jgi:hypothetical protein
VGLVADDRLLQHLKQNSEWLQEQLEYFKPISGDLKTKFAYEEYETLTRFGRSILVSEEASAKLNQHGRLEYTSPRALHPADRSTSQMRHSGMTMHSIQA